MCGLARLGQVSVGSGGQVVSRGDGYTSSRCLALPFFRLSVGHVENASLRSTGHCGSCRVLGVVRLCLAGLVSVLCDVEVVRSLTWPGCRVIGGLLV